MRENQLTLFENLFLEGTEEFKRSKKLSRRKSTVYIPNHKIDKFETKLRSKEVARFLNVVERTVLNLRLKKMPFIKLSKRKFYFAEKDVIELVNKNYHPPLILDEEIDLPPLTMKDRLLAVRDVVEFFHRTMSASTITQFRLERKLGYVKLSDTIYRYPERDILEFINKNYQSKLSYDE